jgi:hypothetical protein
MRGPDLSHFASAAQSPSLAGTSRTGVASIGSINGSRPGTTAMSPPRGKGRARPGRPRQRQGVPATCYLPSRATPDAQADRPPIMICTGQFRARVPTTRPAIWHPFDSYPGAARRLGFLVQSARS